MSSVSQLDCVVIGYNNLPFHHYERLLAGYGKNSETYRDLRFSFVDIEGRKMDYCDLLNRAWAISQNQEDLPEADQFKSGDMPNLAAAYLTNVLRKQFSVRYINLFQHEQQELEKLLKLNPLCIAITTTFYVLNLPVVEMVRFIRERNAQVKIVVGGPLIGNHHRRLTPQEFFTALDEINADLYVVDGQGEATLECIVAALKTGTAVKDIPNIAFRSNGNWQMTPLSPENNSLENNYIDWTKLSDHQLGYTLQSRTARSCAFNCAFCAYPSRAGKLTLASVDTVEKELESMRSVGGIHNVVFIDDTFNVPLKRFKELCQRMIDRKFEFKWYSYFRCSNADEEAIELAAQSGCKGVFLGIESGSNTILKNMNKAAAVDQYRSGVESLKRHGILTFGSFIVGFPGETQETFHETVSFIRESELDYYRIQLWYCEPGTPIGDQREKWDINGNGFRWKHATMNSAEAMALIEDAFLDIDESVWLPQWSFDFWIIPYLTGRGIHQETFKNFMAVANRMLSLEIAGVSGESKAKLQQKYLQEMAAVLRTQEIISRSTVKV